jgi:hypothetical protein
MTSGARNPLSEPLCDDLAETENLVRTRDGSLAGLRMAENGGALTLTQPLAGWLRLEGRDEPSHQKQVAFSRDFGGRTARSVAANSAPQYHAVDFGPSCCVRGDPEPILKPLRTHRRKTPAGDLLRRGETGTERDRPRWLEVVMGPGRIAREYVRTHGRKVVEIMTQNVITVTADTPLDGIVQLMERRRIKRVPVMEGDALVGIVSRADLLRALALVFEKQSGEIPGDAEILEQIHAELAKVAWVPRDGLSITVEDGVVDRNGVILEERKREALRVVAENVAGVKTVEDHLVWIEPVSGIVIDLRQDERGSS